MKKQGFTLVELLAVIAILAILILIALPNIMSLFNSAKENSFITETKKIFDTAHQQWMSDSMFDTNEIVYSRVKGQTCSKQLKLSGREEINYYIKLDKAGNVIEYATEDGTYQYSYNGTGLKIEDINNPTQIATISLDNKLTISCTGTTGGSSMNNSEYDIYTSDYTHVGNEISDNINYYTSIEEVDTFPVLLHHVSNNKIKNSSIVIPADENFLILRGGGASYNESTGEYNNDSQYFEQNKNIISQMFDESAASTSCYNEENRYYCLSCARRPNGECGSLHFWGETRANGYVYYKIYNFSCTITSNGESYCSEDFD